MKEPGLRLKTKDWAWIACRSLIEKSFISASRIHPCSGELFSSAGLGTYVASYRVVAVVVSRNDHWLFVLSRQALFGWKLLTDYVGCCYDDIMSDRVSVSATTVWLEEWRREASLHVGGMHLAPRMPRAVDNGCCGLSLSWRKVNGGGVLFG